MSKVCKDCGELKPLKDYYIHKGMKDGYLNKCKTCVKAYNRKQDHAAKDRTEKGVIRVLYKTMKRNQKLRGHGELPFSKKDFRDWLYQNNFEKLYNLWVQSCHNKDDKPSVDRLNDFKGYSFSNMRLVSWRDNHLHQVNDILSGTGTSGKRCKSVGKFDQYGNLLVTYTSYQEVRRLEGYCVQYPVKNKYACKNGYIWKEM